MMALSQLLYWFTWPLLVGTVMMEAWADPLIPPVPAHDVQPVPLYPNYVALAGKQVPLPAQPWVVAGHTVLHLPSAPAPVDSLILFSVTTDHMVDAFIAIHANITPASAGWGISRDCQNQEGRFAHILEHRDQHYFCVFVQADGYQPDVFAAWLPAAQLAARNHWRLPEHWGVIGFRIADEQDVLDVRYGLRATPTAPKDPLPGTPAVAEKPDLATQQLIRWQEGARDWVERGFSNQISDALPLSRLGTDLPALSTRDDRLRKLEALRVRGWISEADFQAQRTSATAPVTIDPDDAVDIWRLGLEKTAVHSVQTTLWMFSINYLFLGNIYLAGGLALAKGFFSPARYYLHELAWNTWGPRNNPTLPVIDFSRSGH